MFNKKILLTMFSLGLFSSAAHAAILYTAPPSSSGLAAYTTIITINGDGSTTTTSGGGGAFGGEDSFIHVVNNSATSVAGFSLAGTDIFGFDGDGTLGGTDPLDYSGSLVSFTFDPANTNTGSVTFIGGLAANSDLYFELEEDVSVAGSGFTVGPITPTGPVGVPEPTTLALLGAGLFTLVGSRMRRRNA